MAMKHIGKVLGQKLPAMEGEVAAAYLQDFAVSEDVEKPITCGLFRLEAGKAMTYTYSYHEMKLVVDGEFEITDEQSGQTVVATAGDLFYFSKGSTITFATRNFGVGFFCGQRGEGEAWP